MSKALTRVATDDLSTWGDRRLDGWIKRGHATAGAHSKSYEQAAAVTGLLLIEKKSRLPYGKWTPWLEKHFNGSADTALRYMEMAKIMALKIRTDAESESAESGPWTDAENELRDLLDQGQTIVVHLRDHERLIDWATDRDLFVRVDRNTRWGNPFVLDDDGERDTVIAAYRDHYLPHKRSLLARLDELRGKALGCWCAPDACHADVLYAVLETPELEPELVARRDALVGPVGMRVHPENFQG